MRRLVAEDRILDQGRNHRSNEQPELEALPEVVRADDRVLDTEPDVERQLANPDRFSDVRPDRHVPLVPRTGPIVVADGRIQPDLPGIG